MQIEFKVPVSSTPEEEHKEKRRQGVGSLPVRQAGVCPRGLRPLLEKGHFLQPKRPERRAAREPAQEAAGVGGDQTLADSGDTISPKSFWA